MITHSTTLLRAIRLYLCCVFAAGVLCNASAAGGPTNAPAPAKTVEIAKSTFAMPRNRNEGRDPFFPSSTYPYEQAGTKPRPGQATGSVDLKLTGIGGTATKRLANINGRTFGKDEDGEMTVNGNKVQIHIVDILEDSVILTVNGEQRELRFRGIFNR
jgi:hypothetical protein